MFYCDNLKIRDTYGRERIFRGINLCFKNHNIRHLPKKATNDIDEYKKIGVNIIRLGITWAAIEPEKGNYNDVLIESIKDFILLCGKNDIYVMLDMHQDLFSHYFHGDGAPNWAIDMSYPNERPYAIWAEGYFYMQGVQNAFYDFWTNKNNIQSKFIKMWQYVANKLSNCENIIGYDYFNEPYLHKNGRKVFLTLASNIIKTAYNRNINFEKYFRGNKDKVGFAKMTMRFFPFICTEKKFHSLLSLMNNEEKFYDAINGLEKYTDEFNSQYYQPFFSKIGESTNKNGILNFFEHSYYANLGLPFEIEHKETDVYSPHAYDIFIDSPLYNNYSSNKRVKCILSRIRENQIKMNVPVLFGEWGGGASGSDWIKHIDFIMSEFEKYHWSSIYWAYNFKSKNLIVFSTDHIPLQFVAIL